MTGNRGLVRWSEALVVKLIYGNAFKARSPELLFAVPVQPGGIVGNRALAPQLMHAVELWGWYSFLRYFNATSGVAYGLLFDKAEPSPRARTRPPATSPACRPCRGRAASTRSCANDLRGYFIFDFQHTSRELGEPGYLAQLVGSARNDGPFWALRFGLSGRLRLIPAFAVQLNAEGRAFGERLATDSNILQRGRPYHLPAYFDLAASLSLVELFLLPHRETVISVRGYNLLGRTTADPGYRGVDYPRVGRELYLELIQQL